MSEFNIFKMQEKLKKYLDEDRFTHTQGVMYTSAALAMRYGEDVRKAQAAGLLHDCAKCIPNDKKISICEKNGIPISDAERKNPFLLHAKAGAQIAKEKYKITDPDILNAIAYHTTGRPGMSLLEKIVYIADYIEPWRYKAQNLELSRKMAFSDIDEALYIILRDTLSYLKSTKNELDPMTARAFEYYKEMNREKQLMRQEGK
ncbi:bis(5'-nucleosyl)-tetraphosphatase (symmetrical) YqeK [uncultured Robinsoniella sp.]|uniref:bis(5'-nucleosyl)-tetraphosphatase (symmetrical) YqeK n=1 Tax=uncultured Robinsoniella sp. TaxID=904190 RepID=UPI00374EC722